MKSILPNGGLYGKKLRFGISGNGAWCNITPGTRMVCSFCGKRFKALEIAVEFMESDVCPECILSGPKEMALRIKKHIPIEREDWIVPELARIAKRLEKVDSILDIEGGIFALKIAEAYREAITQRDARKGTAA